MASWQEMPSEAEEIVEWAMDRKKPLCLPRGFEPAHLAFSVARLGPGQQTPPTPDPARCPVPMGQEGRQRISTL